MAYTLSQYELLCDAISQGVLKVEYADKKVEYRSLKEMYMIKSSMENELFPEKTPVSRKYATFSKGII